MGLIDADQARMLLAVKGNAMYLAVDIAMFGQDRCAPGRKVDVFELVPEAPECFAVDELEPCAQHRLAHIRRSSQNNGRLGPGHVCRMEHRESEHYRSQTQAQMKYLIRGQKMIIGSDRYPA
jgi:hypothetical protein